jgi:vitamin K-dependent gamma-carboxylase-like protein
MWRAESPSKNGWIDHALFTSVDPITTALFRIALAGMVVLVFWPVRWPLPEIADSSPIIRYIYHRMFLTSAYWTIVVTVAALLAVGVRPRLAGATLAVLLLPLVPFEGKQPGRQVLAATVLAFSFLRSDTALSLCPRRGPVPGSAGPCWPIRVVQLQLSVLYAANAISKTTPDYLSGQIAGVMMRVLPNFLLRPEDGHVDVGVVSIPLWLAATGVVLTEYALAIGFWFRRTRTATAVLGVAFHTTLHYVIRIGFLDVVSLFLYAAFLLPFERRRGPARTGGNGRALEAQETQIRTVGTAESR